jgi:hypothetical protein
MDVMGTLAALAACKCPCDVSAPAEGRVRGPAIGPLRLRLPLRADLPVRLLLILQVDLPEDRTSR